MSCQIKNGEYFAPNGNESILFKELKDKVGEAQAQDLFVLAYSNEFKRSEVQPIVNSYKNNILSKLNSITPKTKDLQYKIVKTEKSALLIWCQKIEIISKYTVLAVIML